MLVGRERELAVLAASAAAARGAESGAPALARAGGEPGQVVEIVGAVGIGKSALLATISEQLAGDGFQVVTHRATAPERSLPWATLLSLLGQIQSPADRQLAASHRQHLRAVVTPGAGADPRPHGVAVATGELIALAAEAQPLALVVDDAQWVDAPSAAVLTFVARRLDRQRALLLFARDAAQPAAIAADVAGASAWQPLELGACRSMPWPSSYGG